MRLQAEQNKSFKINEKLKKINITHIILGKIPVLFCTTAKEFYVQRGTELSRNQFEVQLKLLSCFQNYEINFWESENKTGCTTPDVFFFKSRTEAK